LTPDEKKQQVAQAALAFVEPNTIVGVGTGSTANYFIEALATIKHTIEGTVASSQATVDRLKAHHIPVYDLNGITEMALYVDGADEVNKYLHLIKGGGGALTREKIVAAVSDKFVCIVDDSKRVDILGAFPLPIEVVPMARSYVARQLTKLGGKPVWRQDFVTDNGNVILDVHNLQIMQPVELEMELNQITGVVTNGLFAKRPADVVLVGSDSGVETLE